MRSKNAIIIIEDDPDDQQVLQEVLNNAGVKNELLLFDDCDKAYNYLMSTTEKPFLIISDINLPKMNGIELKQKIDATDYLRKKAIPFIFLTTSDKQVTVDDAYRTTNLQGYFKKGSSMQEIKEKINCILAYWTEALHPYGS
jgi:response regulator RpfG family c-di-GMP phosphodiesterase